MLVANIPCTQKEEGEDGKIYYIGKEEKNKRTSGEKERLYLGKTERNK